MNPGSDVLVVDAIRTCVPQSGQGKSILLIHGLGGPQMWQRCIPLLEKNFHVVAPHLPGFGKSDCPPSNYSTEQYAEFILHLLDKLALQRIILAGTSYGAQIAVTFAHAYPERLDKLILASSTGLRSRRWLAHNPLLWNIFSFLLKYCVLNNMPMLDLLGRRSFYNLAKRPDDLVKQFYFHLSERGKRETWIHALRNIFATPDDFHRQLEEITLPTLILWGKHDRAIPLTVGNEFRNNIKNSMLVVFSGCAHSLPLEEPFEMNQTIHTFIGSIPS